MRKTKLFLAAWIVSWHVTQWVPAMCGGSLAATGDRDDFGTTMGSCYKKVDADMKKEFLTEAEAQEFIDTMPDKEYRDYWQAAISDVDLEQITE